MPIINRYIHPRNIGSVYRTPSIEKRSEEINIETYNLPQDKEYELTNVNDSDTLKLVNERL